MDHAAMETLMERWENDSSFRTQMRQDPEGAIRATGVSLSEDELAAVRDIDWSLSDEELSARASKAGRY